MYTTVEFTRLLSLSGAGALRVGEARLREGKVRRLHCAGQQQTTARLSRARSYVLSVVADTAAVPPLSVFRAVSCSPRVGLGVLFERPDAAANVLGVIAPFSRTSATFPVLLAGAASSKRSRDVCSLKMLQAA